MFGKMQKLVCRSVSILLFVMVAFWSLPVFAQDDIERRLVACEQRIKNDKTNIMAILEAAQVPSDFVFLMCAESTGDTSKCSTQNACGAWQLMPATARRFGLKVDGHTDERKDLEKATRAAALYIRTLLDAFDDDISWAVAAYNVGGHNLNHAIRYEKGMKVRVIRDYFPQAYNLVYTFQKMRELAKEAVL